MSPTSIDLDEVPAGSQGRTYKSILARADAGAVPSSFVMLRDHSTEKVLSEYLSRLVEVRANS